MNHHSSAKTSKKSKKSVQDKYWLPIDERLIPDIFSFGRVKGLARIFLEVEFIMVTLVVIGTLVLTVMRLLN